MSDPTTEVEIGEHKVWHCVLCGDLSRGWGNNPEPLKPFESGRCCGVCNADKVIPARLTNIRIALATSDQE